MNIQELTMLLARIQLLDNRMVDQLTIEAWEPMVSDLNFDDAVTAVNVHFRTSDRYLLPVHVVEGAKQAQKRRIAVAQRTPHEFVPGGNRFHPEVCGVCLRDVHTHTDGGCPHRFDETSGYCHHCGIREDRLPPVIRSTSRAA